MMNPGIPIPPEVSAVTHIVDEDLVDKLPDTEVLREVARYIPESHILVAFNSKFDASFLPLFLGRRWICAYRLARHLYPDAPKHSNQFFRYLFKGSKLNLRGLESHRALADAIVTKFVFEKLVEKYLADGHEDDMDALL